MKKVSVIVPVLNEERVLPGLLNHLETFPVEEFVIVDGGSQDNTRTILQKWSKGPDPGHCRVVFMEASSRAGQMNLGAARAKGDLFLFLHADSRIPPNGLDSMQSALGSSTVVGGTFRLKIDSPSIFLKVISLTANLRSRFLGLPYGDQGYFVKKEAFFQLGGYRQIPLMEDVDFIRRLRKIGRIVLLKDALTTSPRRWIKEGYLYASLRNMILIILFSLGVSPLRLAKWYDY